MGGAGGRGGEEGAFLVLSKKLPRPARPADVAWPTSFHSKNTDYKYLVSVNVGAPFLLFTYADL